MDVQAVCREHTLDELLSASEQKLDDLTSGESAWSLCPPVFPGCARAHTRGDAGGHFLAKQVQRSSGVQDRCTVQKKIDTPLRALLM